MSGEFECIVGGISYRTSVAVLSSVSESFFQTAHSVPWNSTGANVLRVDRDGTFLIIFALDIFLVIQLVVAPSQKMF
eukprot:gene27077-32715_t